MCSFSALPSIYNSTANLTVMDDVNKTMQINTTYIIDFNDTSEEETDLTSYNITDKTVSKNESKPDLHVVLPISAFDTFFRGNSSLKLFFNKFYLDLQNVIESNERHISGTNELMKTLIRNRDTSITRFSPGRSLLSASRFYFQVKTVYSDIRQSQPDLPSNFYNVKDADSLPFPRNDPSFRRGQFEVDILQNAGKEFNVNPRLYIGNNCEDKTELDQCLNKVVYSKALEGLPYDKEQLLRICR